MFGVLKPSLAHVSAESKALYHASYCNLCAALSASGAGAVNRFFLINDVVTIDWLLTEPAKSDHHPFACNNCKKFGVIGKKSKVTEHQKFLAATSSFMVGVKLKDNALDEPTLKNKARTLAYFPVMRKAKKSLKAFNVLDDFMHNLKLEQRNESEQVRDLKKACKPTENCYERLTLEAGKSLSTLPTETIALLGKYLGRYVYLHDAMKDMDEDKDAGQYNILNISVDYQGEVEQKEAAARRLLEALKSMHLELFEKISSLPRSFGTDSLRIKWESVLFSIEQKLFNLIKPMNNSELFNVLSSFSVIGDGMKGLIKPMIDDNPLSGCPVCKSPEGGGCDACSGSEGCEAPCKAPGGGGCNPFGDE